MSWWPFYVLSPFNLKISFITPANNALNLSVCHFYRSSLCNVFIHWQVERIFLKLFWTFILSVCLKYKFNKLTKTLFGSMDIVYLSFFFLFFFFWSNSSMCMKYNLSQTFRKVHMILRKMRDSKERPHNHNDVTKKWDMLSICIGVE